MIHNPARVASIRVLVAAQIDFIRSLQAKIVKGKLDVLEVARNQTEDIETLFLQDLERQDRTPAEEARWLSSAEHMLLTWGPYLKQTEEQFSKYGDRIQIVGG